MAAEDDVHARVVTRIRALAEEHGLKVSHIPDYAGVSRSHFWSVLGGRKSPTLRWLQTVCDVFDVDVEVLVRRDLPPKKPRR